MYGSALLGGGGVVVDTPSRMPYHSYIVASAVSEDGPTKRPTSVIPTTLLTIVGITETHSPFGEVVCEKIIMGVVFQGT